MPETAIQRAIDIISTHKLAKLLNVSITMIYKYRSQKYITADYHQLIETETKGLVTAKQLSDDLINFKNKFKPQVKCNQSKTGIKTSQKNRQSVGKHRQQVAE